LPEEFNNDIEDVEEEEKEGFDEDPEIPPMNEHTKSEILGTSQEELEIYSLVLAYGNATLGDLALLGKGKSLDQIEGLVNSLKHKNMIMELPGLVPRFQAVPPFDRLAREVTEVTERLEKLRVELKEQIRSASITVKDALVEMISNDLEKANSQSSSTESTKTESLSKIKLKSESLAQLRESIPKRFDGDTTDIIAEWQASTNQVIDRSHDEMETTLASSTDKLKETLTKVGDDSKNISSTFRSEMITSLSEIANSHHTQIENATNSIEGQLSNQTDAINTRMKSAEQRILTSLESVGQAISAAIDSTEENIKISTNESERKLVETIRTAITEIKEHYSTLEENVNSLLAEKMEQEEQLLQTHTTSLDNAFNKMSEQHKSSLQTLRTSQNEAFSSLAASTESDIASLNAAIQELETRSKSFVDTTRESMKTASISTLDEFQEKLNQYSTEVVQDAHSLMNIQKEQMKKKFDELFITMQNTLKESLGSITNSLDQLSVKVDTSHQGMISGINASREVADEEIESKLNDLNQATVSALAQISNSTKGKVEDIQGNLQSTIESSQGSLSSSLNLHEQAINEAWSGLSESKNNLIVSTGNGLKQLTDELNAQAAEISSAGKNKAEAGSTATISSLQSAIGEIMKNQSAAIDSARTSLFGSIEGNSGNVKSTLSTTTDEALHLIEGVRESISETTNSILSSISEHKSQMQSKLNSSIDTLDSAILSNLASGQQSIDGIITDTRSTFVARNENLKSTVESLTTDLKQKGVEILRANIDDATTGLDEISSNIQSDIAESFNDLRSQVDTYAETLASSKTKLEESPMLGLTDETLEKAFASSSGDQVDTKEIAEGLSSAWKRVQATDFPGAKKTWTVVTREAVNAHIKDMLERAKSKATLIVPEASDVPTEVLKGLKTTTGVELVVTESGLLGSAVKPLVGKGNIRVRSRSEKDVFACVRDSEEVLMAPAAAQDVDVIGVVSEDDGFVKFVMSIIGPIFQAKTKLLKPEDL